MFVMQRYSPRKYEIHWTHCKQFIECLLVLIDFSCFWMHNAAIKSFLPLSSLILFFPLFFFALTFWYLYTHCAYLICSQFILRQDNQISTPSVRHLFLWKAIEHMQGRNDLIEATGCCRVESHWRNWGLQFKKRGSCRGGAMQAVEVQKQSPRQWSVSTKF